MIPLEKGLGLASKAAINFVWSIERIDACSRASNKVLVLVNALNEE
jgi:hypothetical protein